MRNLQGRSEILAVSVHFEKDSDVDHFDDHDIVESSHSKVALSSTELDELQLSETLQKQSISKGNGNDNKKAEVGGGEVKQNKCSTCNAVVGDAKQYREHFKSDWHKHNLRRKTRQLPPLTADECLADVEIGDMKADLKEYSF